jgi:hypothetical protein
VSAVRVMRARVNAVDEELEAVFAAWVMRVRLSPSTTDIPPPLTLTSYMFASLGPGPGLQPPETRPKARNKSYQRPC